MSFVDLSRDLVSDLYRYMSPVELYQRRNIDPVWYQRYLKVLKDWSQVAEPWNYAFENNEVELLRDLLGVSGLPSYQKFGTRLKPIYSDLYLYNSLLEKAVLRGRTEVAKVFTDWLIENGLFVEGIGYLVLYNDRYLRYYFERITPRNFGNRIHNFGQTLWTTSIEEAYRKSIIDDAWLIELYQSLTESSNCYDIAHAIDLDLLLKDILGVRVPGDIVDMLDSKILGLDIAFST